MTAPAASLGALRLIRYLEERPAGFGPLLILTHDHPDPDALASAWALSRLAQALCRVRSRIVYSGVVGRRENVAMLKSLWIPAHHLWKSDLQSARIALVDTQPPFQNNRFPVERRPEIIIDHHPRHPRTRADFAIIDESAGATTTILAEALQAAEVGVTWRLATAIVHAIGAETQNLRRDAGPRDIAAYRAYLPQADLQALGRIVNPPRSAAFFRMFARGICDAFMCRGVIGVHLRGIPDPDAVARIADFLLTHERMRWSLVTGRYQGRLHVSLRTTSTSDDAGRLLKKLLGGGDRAGGHRMMAGGSLSVGCAAPEKAWRQAEERVVRSFLRSRRVTGRVEYPFRLDGTHPAD